MIVLHNPQHNKERKVKTMTEVATRPAAGKDAVTTNLTIDWEGMAEDDIRALAQQALVVKLQGQWRKDGIPSGDHTVKAVEYKPGTRAARKPADLKTLLAAMSPEDRAALLAQFAA